MPRVKYGYGSLKGGESVSVTLPPGQKWQLVEIAARMKMTVQQYLRDLIDEAIAKEFGEKPDH